MDWKQIYKRRDFVEGQCCFLETKTTLTMGDVPYPNPFHTPRYSYTVAGEHRGHQRHNNHRQLLHQEIYIPYFNSYTFASDPQPDYFSRSFHDAGRSAVSFPDSETEAEFELEASSEEEIELKEDADFLVDEENDQVSFITDLFERPAQDSNLCLGLALRLGQIDEDMDDCNGTTSAGLGVGIERSDYTSEVDLELGLCLGTGSDNGVEFCSGTFEAVEPKPPVNAGVSGQEPSFRGGLRVVDIDSESDSDQNVVFDSQIHSDFVEIDGTERTGDFDHPPFCWDYLGFNQQQQNGSHNFEWQEQEDEEEEVVYDDDWDLEASSIVIDPLVEADDVLFDWYGDEADQVSLHSDSLEEAFQGLEWEILLAVNRELDDETMFGVAESEAEESVNGNPPAAKCVVETLPAVSLSHEELKENEITCAICWSAVSATEPVRQLPCRHYYHGDCIMTWLGIRNTCPVCRYELPTDDFEYEYEKREMDGFQEDLPVTYENFHVFL